MLSNLPEVTEVRKMKNIRKMSTCVFGSLEPMHLLCYHATNISLPTALTLPFSHHVFKHIHPEFIQYSPCGKIT